MRSIMSFKALKIAAFTAVALSLGACSKDPTAGDVSECSWRANFIFP